MDLTTKHLHEVLIAGEKKGTLMIEEDMRAVAKHQAQGDEAGVLTHLESARISVQMTMVVAAMRERLVELDPSLKYEGE